MLIGVCCAYDMLTMFTSLDLTICIRVCCSPIILQHVIKRKAVSLCSS